MVDKLMKSIKNGYFDATPD